MNIIKRIAGWLGILEVKVMIAGDMGDLARLAGGMEEAYILKRVMDWCQSNDKRGSKRHYKEGQWWMYYSYKEWVEKEVGWLTSRQVERVIGSLESRGLLIGKVFREGDSKWYRPNWELIKGMDGEMRRKIIRFDPSPNRETPSPNGDTPSRNRDTPFTKRGNINSFINPLSKRFNQAVNQADGLTPDKSNSMKPKDDKSGDDLSYCVNRWGQAEVDRAVLKAQKYPVKNLAGYVRTMLETAESKGEIGVSSNPLVRSMEKALTPQPPLAGVDTPQSQVERGSETPPVAKSREAEAWELAYGQLELQLDRANFDTWLRDVVYVDAKDNVYTIQARTVMAREMLQHRLYRNVRRVLSDVLGAEVELNFVVSGEAVAS